MCFVCLCVRLSVFLSVRCLSRDLSFVSSVFIAGTFNDITSSEYRVGYVFCQSIFASDFNAIKHSNTCLKYMKV